MDVFAEMPAVELVVSRNVSGMEVGVQRVVEGEMTKGLISASYSEALGELGFKYVVLSGGDPLSCVLEADCKALMDGFYHSAGDHFNLLSLWARVLC